MELKNYLAIFWRRKRIILIVALLTVEVVTIGTLKMTPLYTASATLRIATAPVGSVDSINYNITYADRLMQTYLQVATSNPMLNSLAQKLAVDKLPNISLKVLANTELMQISAEDRDPLVAQNAANGLAELLIAYAKKSQLESGKTTVGDLGAQLAQAQSDLDKARQEYETLAAQTPKDTDKVAAASELMQSKVQAFASLLALYQRVQAAQSLSSSEVSVVEPAALPVDPSSPRIPLNIALGSLIGLLVGVLLAFLIENLDTTLYTTEQIGHVTELPVLGKIPIGKSGRTGAFLNGTSPEGEAFRHVRTRLLSLGAGGPPSLLLITSADPGEGKSTILSNLAYSLAQIGQKVLVIDCDLRVPTMHKVFEVPNQIGLSNILSEEVSPLEAARTTRVPGIQVIPSGPPPSNPAEVLASPRMSSMLNQISPYFDTVLLDSTSLLAVTDALILVPDVDGVVMVVARAHSREAHTRVACELLREAKANLLGVVVNRAEEDVEYGYYHKSHPNGRGGQRRARANWDRIARKLDRIAEWISRP